MMNAVQTTISHSVPVSAGPIPELSGSIRDGVSVRNERLRLPEPSTRTWPISTASTRERGDDAEDQAAP